MKLGDIIKKVGENKLREALESKSGDMLKKVFEDAGIKITPEQLDFIAGGAGINWDEEATVCVHDPFYGTD